MPEQERKANMFRIRMTQAEREEIDRAAESEDKSSSDWARKVLLRSAKRKLS